MPVDYKNSKIYRLVCSETGNQYIGSTTQPLYKRLHQHKIKSNTCSSKCLINPEIFLVENVSCNSKEELHKIERKFIESIDCVNKVIPTRTQKEWYQDNRESIIEQKRDYHQNNKEKSKEYIKINKEKISEHQKEWYKDNKESILGRQKEYNQINKERIRERRKTKVNCECGSEITTGNLLTHKKSTKHIDRMNLLQSL